MNKQAALLHIEDDELERRAFLRLVRDKGLPWEVKQAATLDAARACLAKSRFDVIVADSHLPDGESTELFGEIAETPFVLVTGTLQEQMALRLMERGADDYLVKDVEHRHLDALPVVVAKTLYRQALHERERRLTRELAAAKLVAENARVAAEHASRAKDHFLAVLSHELRTPLTPVVAALSMLKDGHRCKGHVPEMLEIIRRNVDLEVRLIDDLLDMTRITRGKIELHKQPATFGEVIGRAVEICRPDIEARQLNFSVDLGSAAACLVHADAGRLHQVFWNLLKNAIKFTPKGGCVGIHCQVDGHNVVAEVGDSGRGIEPEDLGRIFNAFEQAERSITRQFGGLGLGLAIARAIVELHGGEISASSGGKGKGATFTVKLPLLSVVRGPSSVAADSELRTTDHGPRTAAQPLRILLVEDHGDTARMMRQLLTMDGHDVKVAGDVATALEEAGKGSFDLLLSDLGLPDGCGMDLMTTLRARGCTMPGIALSGYGREADICRSREAGFVAHLTKPTSPDLLAEAIAAVAGRGSPGSAAPA